MKEQFTAGCRTTEAIIKGRKECDSATRPALRVNGTVLLLPALAIWGEKLLEGVMRPAQTPKASRHGSYLSERRLKSTRATIQLFRKSRWISKQLLRGRTT